VPETPFEEGRQEGPTGGAPQGSSPPGDPAPPASSADTTLLLRDQIRENQLMFELGSRISSSLDLEAVLDHILDAVGELVPYDAACVYLLDPKGEDVVSVTERGYAPGSEEFLRVKVGAGIVGWVAMSGQDTIVGDVLHDPRYRKAREETRSEVVVPIRSGRDIIGVLNLESDDRGAYDADDLQRLNRFAAQAAIGIRMASLYREIAEKRRMEQELVVARRLQRHFLPDRDPENLPGLEISGGNVPSLEVGGDYYDFIDVAPGQLGIVIGDVAGKGIPAGLLMATFRASLVAEVRNNYSIRTILAKVNRLLCESTVPSEFVTAVYGVVDLEKRVFTYSNAGHNPPLRIRADRGTSQLSKGGLILGAFPNAEYVESRLQLVPGDVLVFYTDGVTEAMNAEGQEFGVEGLDACVRRNLSLPARSICDAVRAEVRGHTAGDELEDDLTLVVVKVQA
jgi:sigma-B regulation protein RsbU (phosphoserine phosphatase)